MEEINLIIDTTKESMESSLKHLESAFNKIRAGRANPLMLQNILVEYYGTPTPLSQVANISVPDGMTLSIQPWEKSTLSAIEKAIFQSNLGFTPNNNGENIIINIPPLTEERRKDLVKQAKAECENSKVGIRKARQEANADIKKIESASEDEKKNGEEQIQSLTDKYVKLAEEHLSHKEKEIMTV
ncbi:MAG: ribosome recycling factor [Apibacter sp.]|jgi:ribosome recycling factor|uniref:Ribosome-recycling factor n=1 Tax=Apibacter mensalis TaxID=1586267 RepID=A0A0X3ALW3_9FLAO|nr:ribosome recycling factor [Apibacter mensalis]MCO6564656.1 ribosome recycling factor [Apibacter sp.]CVK15336.1 ribosome recycling factor [Apibacter mensalis]